MLMLMLLVKFDGGPTWRLHLHHQPDPFFLLPSFIVLH
jgi:hypothetical protein